MSRLKRKLDFSSLEIHLSSSHKVVRCYLIFYIFFIVRSQYGSITITTRHFEEVGGPLKHQLSETWKMNSPRIVSLLSPNRKIGNLILISINNSTLSD